MVKIQQKTRKGSSVNEDLVWTDDGAAIVLDGATGVSDRVYSDFETDGKWYVQTLAEEIEKRIYDSRTLSDIIATSIERTATQYDELVWGGAEPEDHETPSAAGVIIRWTSTEIEYFVIADCSLIVQTGDGTLPIIGEGPRDLDQRIIDEMIAIREQEENISYQEIYSRIQPIMTKHRKLKNQPNGYWVLGLNKDAVEHAQTGTIDRKNVEFLVAFTDGFEPINTQFDAFADWDGVMKYIQHNGLDRAIRVLRAFENADPECESYPRIHPSDDVGVATIDFNP